MNELLRIGNADISIKEYNGQRVVTFSDIDNVHQRPEGTARLTFNRNKNRFVEGKHFFVCETYEAKNLFNISAPNGIVLITEKGYLKLVKPFGDDLSWEIQDQLVDAYFTVRKITDEELSPQMQILMNMVNKMAIDEIEKKQMKEQIEKHEHSIENIKEAVQPITDNWREEINKKINRIQKNVGSSFSLIRTEMYQELERRAGCNLKIRLSNKKERMSCDGFTKTKINNTNNMDIIEEDKSLKEIFSKIVSEYEVRYCA